jgi:hypothetical protein
MPELTVSPDKVAFLIEKARAFDVKEGVTDPDSGSNASDDQMIDVLEDRGNDPVVQEIAGIVGGMSVDEQVDVLTLVRLGRGDGEIGDWDELRAETAREFDGEPLRQLLGEPLLGDLLAEGLEAFGISLADIEESGSIN